MRKIFCSLMVLALFCLAATRVSCAAAIFGYVVESVVSNSADTSQGLTAAKLSGVLIVIEGTNFQAITDVNGYFGFGQNIPDGVYNIGAYKDGYHLETKKITIQGSAPISLQFVLNRKMSAPSLQMGRVPDVVNVADAVYVAYASVASTKTGSSTGSLPTGSMTSLQYRASIAAGGDPTTLSGMPAPDMDFKNPMSNSGESYTPVSGTPNAVAIVDPYNPRKTNYVSLKTRPLWLTFDNSGTKVFIATDTQYIVVMDVNSGNKLVGSIPSGGIVTDITRAPDGNVYASVSGSRPGIVVISPLTNAAVAFYPVKSSGKSAPDAQPRALAVGTDYIYVVLGSNNSGEVQALNRSGGAVLGTCETGAFPSGVSLTPNGKYLFIANRNNGDVSVIDALRLSPLGRVRVGTQPTRVVSSPLGDKIYVTNYGSNYVSVIDGRTGRISATINTGRGPVGLAITPDGTKLFVTNNLENNMTIINAESNSVIQTTSSSTVSRPFGVAVRPGAKR